MAEFTDTKPAWLSKTIIGAVVTVLALLAGILGVTLDPEEQVVLVDSMYALATAFFAMLGAILAAYGRFKASKAIG
jgi:Mg2+ and Co2+ transporter CorA